MLKRTGQSVRTMSTPPPPPNFDLAGVGARRRRLLSWGLLVVAGLVAGLVGLATLSGSAESQTSGPPAAATNLKATKVTKTSATLTWEAGTGCAATRYHLTLRDPDYAQIAVTVVTPTAALSWEVTGLDAGTEYQVQIATYGASCSPSWGATGVDYFTTLAEPTPTPTPLSPPATPVNLAVSGITETGATFTWEAGAGGGCAATHYFVMHYDADGLRLSSVRIATLSRSVTGLTPGTEYSFSVAADGECGFSSYAPRKSFTTLGAAPKTLYPNKPSGLSVSSITDTTAVLSWTAGADGDCATTAHDVWVELNYGEALWERQGVTGTTVTVTGLSAGTTYTAYVDSYGSTCDESSDFVKERFTTLAAGATPEPTPTPTPAPTPAPPPPPALTISVSDVSVDEGNSGTTAMNFQVTLSGSPSHKVEIRATSRGVGMAAAPGRTPPTASGTGHGRDFFQFTGRNLVFEAGATGAALTKTVTVSVYGDQLDEDDETLILRLNNLRTEATNVSFAGGETSLEATGTISDDDEGKTPRVISVSDTSVAEGAEGERTEMTFTITLSETPTHDVRVRATVRGAGIKATLATPPTAKGTAGEGRDFIRFSNRDVVFAAGATGAALTQTVKVVILGDAVVEGDETLSLRLNNLRTSDGLVRFTGGAKRLFATGTITNDDAN